MLSVDELRSLKVQISVIAAFGVFWSIIIECIRRPLEKWFEKRPWWPTAAPHQKATIMNFGFNKEDVTEHTLIYSFTWIVTMCITHVTSASMMLPVVLLGWYGAGSIGQTAFLLGTWSECGFDVYDVTKNFLLTFFPSYATFLGPKMPVKLFVLLCGFHHSTVLLTILPMNYKYIDISAYHYVGFSLLFSAGVCYIAGHYKLSLNATTPSGLCQAKAIVALQFCMNWTTRMILYVPSCYVLCKTLLDHGDLLYFWPAFIGSVFMGLYNVAVVVDATKAAAKWSTKKIK